MGYHPEHIEASLSSQPQNQYLTTSAEFEINTCITGF